MLCWILIVYFCDVISFNCTSTVRLDNLCSSAFDIWFFVGFFFRQSFLCVQHLKKDFYRKDVQEASRTCFTKLSAAITQLVDSIRQRVPTNKAEKIPFVLMQCLTAVVKQHCADNPLGEGLETDFIQRVEFLLQNILDLNVQGVADEVRHEASFSVVCK